MGQGYKIILLSTRDKRVRNDKKIITSFYPCGSIKLMMFSFIDYLTTRRVENILFENPQRIVVAGDYADEEPQTYKNEVGESVKDNLYDWSRKLNKEDETPYIQYEHKDNREEDFAAYMKAVEEKKIAEPHRRYAINEDKKMFVDLDADGNISDDGGRIHPLMLLLAEGNSRGGGDYWGKNMRLVGSWARDLIRVSDTKPEGYKEFKHRFKEDFKTYHG
jgi:hypothetical protein